MVRVVVTTAVREAAAGSSIYALLRLAGIEDRRATAPPAPPQGLILADVGYETFI
jgi:tRNA U38,U39,U40 pseudouridine synthase TruA